MQPLPIINFSFSIRFVFVLCCVVLAKVLGHNCRYLFFLSYDYICKLIKY